MPLVPRDMEHFCLVEVARVKTNDADAVLILTGDDGRRIALQLSAEKGELLCLQIAEALEDRYAAQ